MIRILVCVLVAVYSAALLALHNWRGHVDLWDTVIHVSIILLMVAVGMGKAFLAPAKEWVQIIVTVLPFDFKIGGRRKSDPPDPAENESLP